ncbi:DgyrCDS10815 [Dimorphilus gyrociliatus]|uniref:acid phosphatase n=1 Tax=Dimorphilus gyrociliatus TaxID=2664684 RepID=A0A7I8W1F5_9ANNE|nr:DgyrCDS10815 [Dimorphilus gyrociliatus]
MLLSNICLVSNIIFLAFYPSNGASLKKVIVVFRHGDRSPIGTYKNDPYITEEYWPQGLLQLTQKGMYQEYNLGKFLKKRYMMNENLLNSTYKKSEIFVESTDTDRTLMSAQSVLNGLYPPVGNQIWRKGLDWQPIPVHTTTYDLILGDYECKALADAISETRKSKNFTETTKMYKKFINKINTNTGENYKTIEDISPFCDNAFCNSQHNNTLKWLSHEELEKCTDFVPAYDGWFQRGSEKKAKYGLGFFFANMSELFHNAKDHKIQRKLTLFSAHDTTIISFFYGLGAKFVAQPTYSSAVMTELWQDKNEWQIKLAYRTLSKDGKEIVKPVKVKGCSNSEFCSFDEFMKIIDKVKLTRDEYNDACVETEVKKLSVATIIAIVASIIICLLASFLVLSWLRRKSSPTPFYTAIHRGS